MKTQYKIYVVGTINSDLEKFSHSYGYGNDIKYPMVFRPLFLESFEDEDTFDSLTAAEQYLDEKLIREYEDTDLLVTKKEEKEKINLYESRGNNKNNRRVEQSIPL